MRWKWPVPILLLGAMAAAHGQPAYSDPLEIQFKKLRENIYLAHRPETLRYWVEGDVVIIINDTDVVVVDASGAPRSAQTVIAKIEELTDKPVRYLINTPGPPGRADIGALTGRRVVENPR